MNYPIPSTPEELLNLRDGPIDTEVVATAIAGVVSMARANGESLDALTAAVLQDDNLLDAQQRNLLSELVAEVWDSI
jgi:hypothetical protein